MNKKSLTNKVVKYVPSEDKEVNVKPPEVITIEVGIQTELLNKNNFDIGKFLLNLI